MPPAGSLVPPRPMPRATKCRGASSGRLAARNQVMPDRAVIQPVALLGGLARAACRHTGLSLGGLAPLARSAVAGPSRQCGRKPMISMLLSRASNRISRRIRAMSRAGRSWRPVYRRMERFGDAANAYARILSLGTPTAELFADYAEMRVYANQGLVTTAAVEPLREALKLDPEESQGALLHGSRRQAGRQDRRSARRMEGPACRFSARCELARSGRKRDRGDRETGAGTDAGTSGRCGSDVGGRSRNHDPRHGRSGSNSGSRPTARISMAGAVSSMRAWSWANATRRRQVSMRHASP